MNKVKYPMSLFIVGVIMNMVVRHVILFLSGFALIILMEKGSFFYYVGIVMIVFDFLLSLGLQMGIRKEVMSESDNPEIQRIQAALAKGGRWTDNVKDIVDDKLDDYEDKLQESRAQKEKFNAMFDDDSDVYDDDSDVYDDEDDEQVKDEPEDEKDYQDDESYSED